MTGKTECTWRKRYPSATLSTRNPTWTRLKLNPGLHGESWLTDRLSCNMASSGLFLQPTLMHNSITTCMSHYYPHHVSGLDMPILRRNNCTNTASGILAVLSGCTLHRLRAVRSQPVQCTAA